MNFRKYYENLEPKELVEIIESLSSYEPEVVDFCVEHLKSLKLSKEKIKKYSKIALENRFFKYFSEGKYLTKELINIDSHFHKEEEVKEIFRQVQSDYIAYAKAATLNLPSG